MTMPGADAGRDLDQAQRARTRGEAGGVLAERRGVGVVRGEHGYAGQAGLDVLGHGVGVPAGQDRRLAGPAGLGVDRARQAERRAAQVVRSRARCCSSRRADRRRDPVEHDSTGPRSTGTSISSWASTAPPRSVSAIRVCVVSTAATSARDWDVLKTRLRRRRPPVASLVSPSTIIPASSSASRRCATVIRDRPVTSRTSPRVVRGRGGSAQHVSGSGRHGHLPSARSESDRGDVIRVATGHKCLTPMAT